MDTTTPQSIGIARVSSHGTAIQEITVDLIPDGPAVCALEELGITSARTFQSVYDIRIIVLHAHRTEITAA